MKKKLKISAQTIRNLSMQELHGVAGGATKNCGSGLCPTREANCPTIGCTYAPQPGCVGTHLCDTTNGFCV